MVTAAATTIPSDNLLAHAGADVLDPKSDNKAAGNSSDVKAGADASAKSPDQLLSTASSSGFALAGASQPQVADAPVLPKEIKWVLVGGKSIRTQLAQWAEVAGWHIDWKINVDWIVPSSVTYGGTFDHALETVIEQLYAQGKPVRLMIWNGNQVAEVVGNDVK